MYPNYNGFFSMVLLAACHSCYCFTLLDFGSYSSNIDRDVLANSLLGKELKSDKIQLPTDEPLGGCIFSPFPYYLLGDKIFPLKKMVD